MNSSPNILVIVTDQHAKSAIGAYGGRICQTPNIDALAAESVVFEHAYTPCPVCSPARASLHTGYYPFRHGMQTNLFMPGCMVHELPDNPGLISRRLGEAGYHAGYTGKWHLGYGRDSFQNDFLNAHVDDIERFRDVVEYPEEYRQASGLPTSLGYIGDDFPGHGGGGHAYPQYLDYLKREGLEARSYPVGEFGHVVTSGPETTLDYFLVERAIEIIEEMKGAGRPWMQMLNFWGPHEPYYPTEEFYRAYRDVEIPPWPSFNEDVAGKPKIHWAKRNGHDWSYYQRELQLYYAYASFIDSQIGRLVARLKASGDWENTVVIFLADHGDSMGIHGGLFDKSMHLFEETVSVPLMIRPRGGTTQRRESRFANLTDVYSTILDLAGVEESLTRRHGRSLLPLVRDEAVPDWPDAVVAESSGIGFALHTSRMIRTGTWKYVFNCGSVDELYDLADDPHEMRNLAGEPSRAGTLAEMRQRLAAWMVEKGDPLRAQFLSLIRAA